MISIHIGSKANKESACGICDKDIAESEPVVTYCTSSSYLTICMVCGVKLTQITVSSLEQEVWASKTVLMGSMDPTKEV